MERTEVACRCVPSVAHFVIRKRVFKSEGMFRVFIAEAGGNALDKCIRIFMCMICY
jgi:hypothetical protein